ncbi:MAG TPA: hypothetical protein PK683_15845, partial [Leptospiraceae bacterium]|nr:hypothetical protein [Leptospiraceae bacterium]
MRYSIFLFSILLCAAGFLNLQTERLADLDFDTSYVLYGLMFDRQILSINPPILHPAISLAYFPFQVFLSAGIHPMTSLQLQYGIYLGLSVILFGLLCYRLTERGIFSFIMAGLFSFFPSIQIIIQTMDDNIYSYPFLFTGLILAFPAAKKKASDIYLRFLGCVIIFSFMVFISMTSFLWVFFLSFLFLLNIFTSLSVKEGLKLLIPVILTGIICTAGFFAFFSSFHSLPIKDFVRETLGFSQNFSSVNSLLLENFSKLEYIKFSLWQGLFSVPRSETAASPLSHMLSFITAKSKTAYPLIYLVFYYLFILKLFIGFRKKKNAEDFSHAANLLLFLVLNLFFLLWYKEDSSFHERWDFFYLTFPWTALLVFRSRKKTDAVFFFLLLSVPLYFGARIFYHSKDNYSDFRSVKKNEGKYEMYVFTQDEVISPSSSMVHILKDYRPLKIVKMAEKPRYEAHLYPFFLISKEAFLQ